VKPKHTTPVCRTARGDEKPPARVLMLAAIVIIVAACTGQPTTSASTLISPDPARTTYGFSDTSPIRVGGGTDFGPAREEWYLNRLRGPGGEMVEYERKGSCCAYGLGSGAFGQGVLDIYEVRYAGQSQPSLLYLDMYQCETPTPPVGFLMYAADRATQGQLFFASHSQILVEDLASSIYVFDMQTQCLQRIAVDGATFAPFSISLDASSLSYSFVTADGSSRLSLADLPSGGQHLLTTGDVWDVMPSLSPDNRDVLFVRQSGANIDIFRMATGGAGATQLTDTPSMDAEPAWSPDGSKVAFSSDRDGDFDIYIMDSDGGNVRQLTNDPATDVSPTWSPDGTEIAFVSDRAGEIDLFRIDTNTLQIQPIHTPGIDDSFPSWSPAGIIALCGVSGDLSSIYLVNPDGTGLEALTESGLANACYPEWAQ
jgi:hypothetical protein